LNIHVSKIGAILPDGTIAINKGLMESGNVKFLLDKIASTKTISHSDLLRKLWRKMNAKALRENIDELVQAGLVSKVVESNITRYRRTSTSFRSTGLSKGTCITKLIEDPEIKEQMNHPVRTSRRDVWVYKNYLLQVICNEYMNSEEITLYIKDYILNHERKIEEIRNRIQTMERVLKTGEASKRENISEHVRMYVWRRDKGKCMECGSIRNLEFDHIIPVSKGGSNTARNIRILCDNCNRSKSDKI